MKLLPVESAQLTEPAVTEPAVTEPTVTEPTVTGPESVARDVPGAPPVS